MKVQVRYFASLRERLGAAQAVDVEAGTTLAALRDRLAASSPEHALALGRGRAIRCALDQRLVGDDAALTEGAEVAFFPPVTGG